MNKKGAVIMGKRFCLMVLCAAICVIVATGCQPAKPDKWEDLYKKSQVIITKLTNENILLKGENERHKRMLENDQIEINALKQKVAVLENLLNKDSQKTVDDLDRLVAKLNVLKERLSAREERATEKEGDDFRKDEEGDDGIQDSDDPDFDVKRVDNLIKITLKGAVYFSSGKDVLTDRGKANLRKISQIMLEAKNVVYRIDGHTDSQPIKHSKKFFRSNRHLSSMRALGVLEYLVKECNIPEDKAFLAGFGEFWPKDTNNTAEGRNKNRRVEIWVMPDTDPSLRR